MPSPHVARDFKLFRVNAELHNSAIIYLINVFEVRKHVGTRAYLSVCVCVCVCVRDVFLNDMNLKN